MLGFIVAQITTSSICFADFGDGLVDLSYMCGQPSEISIATEASTEPSAPTAVTWSVYLPQVDVINDCVDGQINRMLNSARRKCKPQRWTDKW